MKASALIMAVIAAVLITTVGAAALPVTIDKVEIDDVEIFANEVNRLDVQRGEPFDVRVKITGTGNASNVEILAFISGFEFNRFTDERLSDVTEVVEVDEGVSYVRKLRINPSTDVDVDNYKLRIIVSDRFGDAIVQNYNLKLDAKRHEIEVRDVMLNPSDKVKAGTAMLAVVRVENKGQREEDDVKVVVEIPELGVSASDFIDKIKREDAEEETEEMLLRLPVCAKAGNYNLKTTVWFNDQRESVTKNMPIQVVESERCEEGKAMPQGPTTSISVGSQLERVGMGGTVIFPLTVTNLGMQARSYTISVNAPQGFEVTISPTNSAVLQASNSQSFFIFVKAGKDATAGPNVVTATVSSSGETLQQVMLTANVEAAKKSTARQVLEIVLIAVVIVLVIAAIVVALTRMRGAGEEKTYY